MNKTLRKFILIAFVISAVVCVAGVAIIYLVNRSQSAAAAAYAPPDVQITSPADGAEVDSGSNLVVSATAQGAQPVTRAELWVDGQLLATQDPNNPNGDSLLYASFPLQVQAGNHLVFVRALNTQGVIGQSMPISINGVNPVNVTDEGQPIVGTGPTGPIANPVKTGELPVTGNTANPAGGGVAVPPPNNPPVVIINPNPLAVNPPPGGGNNPMVKLLPALGIGNNPLLKIPSLSGIGLNSPPAAPTSLKGWVDNCQLTLVWDDKATNESSYEIWIAGTGQQPQVFATLSSANSQGQAWTMLAAPNPGTYNVWVEAVNWLGKGLSNLITVTVTDCPNTIPAQLYIEAKDLIVPNAIDLVYCYVTIGTAPQAVRIPVDITQFITTVGGSTNIADFAAGQKAMVIPRPAGNTLAMFGECDGWAGGAYTILGTFNESFTSDKWNSTPQKVTLGSSSMTITIHPSPTAPKNTIAGFNDPTLPMPLYLKLSRVGDANGDAAQKFMWENQRQLSWAFLGNTNQFSGYNIYLDGKFSNKVPGAITFSTIVTLPPVCNSGAHVKWQVSAVDPSGKESSKSLPAVLDCAGNVLVEVRFAELVFNSTGGNACDLISVYGNVAVNGYQNTLWSAANPVDVNCDPLDLGTYLGEAGTNPGPLPPNTIQQVFDAKKPIQLTMDAWFSQTFDNNCIGNNCPSLPPDELVFSHYTNVSWLDYEEMRKDYPTNQEGCKMLFSDTKLTGGVRVCIKVSAAPGSLKP